MSDGHEHDDHDDADAHHDHFDGEPATALGPDEPQTPGWVPLVGAFVFVAGAVFFVTQREALPTSASAKDGPAANAAQTVAAPQQPRPIQPIQAQPRPAQAQPPAAADSADLGGVKRLSPDQLKDLQKRIQEAKAKQQQQQAPGAQPR